MFHVKQFEPIEGSARGKSRPISQNSTFTRIRISGTVSRNRNMLCVVARAANFGFAPYCWDRMTLSVPHGIASRKTLTEATSGSIPGTNERTTAARAGKASRRMKETMYAHLSLTTSDSFMRDIS